MELTAVCVNVINHDREHTDIRLSFYFSSPEDSHHVQFPSCVTKVQLVKYLRSLVSLIEDSI